MNITDTSLTDPAVIAELEQVWSSELKELANQALQLSQKQLKADLFKFAVEFRRRYPKQWKEQQHNWEAIFSKMAVNIKVEANIARTGKSTQPQGVTKQEAD
ncbi:hypothetical protein D3C74_202940 [compost metagenome]